MNLVVIPARGGSKRIPRKNIKDFSGQPIIRYSILAARESGIADRVIVSTDDDEIAEIAFQCGAEVPFRRPTALSNDFAGTIEVIQHAIEAMATLDCHPDNVCCLYATAPFVSGELLREGLDELQQSGRSYAFTVATFGFPIQRALRIIPDGGIEPIYPEYRYTRSQDLEEAYQDAGQFYWGKTSAWKSGTPIYSSESTPILIPRHQVQDIDTPEDWTRAELLYKVYQLHQREQSL